MTALIDGLEQLQVSRQYIKARKLFFEWETIYRNLTFKSRSCYPYNIICIINKTLQMRCLLIDFNRVSCNNGSKTSTLLLEVSNAHVFVYSVTGPCACSRKHKHKLFLQIIELLQCKLCICI